MPLWRDPRARRFRSAKAAEARLQRGEEHEGRQRRSESVLRVFLKANLPLLLLEKEIADKHRVNSR
jgi:hypothetical protein